MREREEGGMVPSLGEGEVGVLSGEREEVVGGRG